MAVEKFSWGKPPQVGIPTVGTNLARLEPSPEVFETPKKPPVAVVGRIAHRSENKSKTISLLHCLRTSPQVPQAISRWPMFIRFVIE